MTTFMNLMVVLVPFLLISAVFSRIAIVELDLPSAKGAPPTAPTFRVEVVVRDAGLEIMDGAQVIAAIPKVDGKYDLPKLSEYLGDCRYPDKSDASVLLEPDITRPFTQVLDTVRSVGRVTRQVARRPFTAISARCAMKSRRIRRMTRLCAVPS
jgi:biopolymer transport protein ExbD